MALTYCENCEQLECETEVSDDGDELCKSCGEPTRTVPEHDDYEMER